MMNLGVHAYAWTPEWNNSQLLLLCGAAASLGLPVPEQQELIDRTLLAAWLQRAVGWDEMTDHRFLSKDYSVQETTFSSGAKVWVDFSSGKFRITGVTGISGEERQAQADR